MNGDQVKKNTIITFTIIFAVLRYLLVVVLLGVRDWLILDSMQGTVNITLDVADLEGYYYIGVSAQALNSYTGGRSEFYGGDKGIQQFTSYVRCNGVTFNK